MTFTVLKKTTPFLIVVIIASIFVCQSAALNLIITDSNGAANVTTLLSPKTTTGEQDYNITAVPIIADPVDSCSEFKNAADMDGKIVIVEWGGCSPMAKTRLAQANGAVAVLVREPLAVVPGQYFSMIDGTDLSDIVIPLLYISLPTSDELKKALEMADVDVEVNVWPEPGPWEQQSTGYGLIIFWSPIQAAHLALAIWASFLLVQHIIQYQKKKLLPLIILPIIIASSIVRIFFFFITAMLQARVPAFNLPIYATFILAPLAEAVLQVAFALIAFTWYEAMTQTKSVPKTFSKMRMPAIICSVIVAGATSIINIVSGALYSTLIIAVTGIIALMFYIALFVLYLVAAIKLYRILFRADAHRSAEHSQKMQDFIRRVIALLIAIFLNLLGSIFLLTMGADPVLFTWFVYPVGRGIFILISMYIATSFFQLSYVPASSKSKGKSGGSASGDGSKKGTTAAGESTKGEASITNSLK